jgi:S1-C subfamily serine protease
VLRVQGLRAPALRLAGSAPLNAQAAILGFPRNGPYDVRAARIGATSVVVSQDAYGAGPVRRRMTSFRGTVRSGNSGGPLVDADGRVAATIFAARTGGGPRGGYAVPNDVVRRVLAGAREPVGTGPCTAG